MEEAEAVVKMVAMEKAAVAMEKAAVAAVAAVVAVAAMAAVDWGSCYTPPR